jgi:hypothetical protein
MAKIEAIDFKRRRTIPTKYKTLLILFCILGILISSFWNKKRIESLVIDQETIMFEEINTQSVIINFVIDNTTKREKSEKIKIEIVDQDNYLITSTIKFLDFKSGRNYYNEQIRFKRRYPDIESRKLRAIITVQPRKF